MLRFAPSRTAFLLQPAITVAAVFVAMVGRADAAFAGASALGAIIAMLVLACAWHYVAWLAAMRAVVADGAGVIDYVAHAAPPFCAAAMLPSIPATLSARRVITVSEQSSQPR